MLDQAMKTGQHVDSPPENLVNELNAARTEGSGQPTKSLDSPKGANSKAEPNSLELSNPFKNNAESKSAAGAAEVKAAPAGADKAKDAPAQKAAETTDKPEIR